MDNLPEFTMVRPPGSGVDEAAGNTRNEQLVNNLKFGDVVQVFVSRFQHRVEFLGLYDCTRKTIQDETVFFLFV
jgi:hypothetical protein